MSSRIILKLPSQMEYLGVPDAVLMEIGSDLDCCTRSLEELGTSVIEACTNAMEHGNKLDEETPIEVIFDVEDLTIKITVLDRGPGFDFKGWEPSQELMRERGRGILIMREFCDTLEFQRHEDGRFMIVLTKKLDSDDDCD
ncbi:MAG: ATP-binding protein [bacterium]|nr:ATP-binding protein [bacterium]